MRKKIKLKTICALIFTGVLSAHHGRGQTYGSGDVGNGSGNLSGTTGPFSTYLGCGAGKKSNTDRNTFIGDSAGFNNTTAADNVAVGARALLKQSYTFQDQPSCNVAVGNYSLYRNDPTNKDNAIKNTAIGHNSGFSNTIGKENIFSGAWAGYSNTTGNGNTVSGFESGYYNQTGGANTISGYQAGGKGGGAASSFSNNSFFGYRAGYSNTTGSGNVMSGFEAGYSNRTGSTNVILGYQAGRASTTPDCNVFIGHKAGYSNTTARGNVFVGDQAGNFNTTGTYHTAIGWEALFNNTTGYWNTATGTQALYTNTTGYKNVASGYLAGYTNNGNNNVFSGYQSGYNNSTGHENSIVGYQSGYNNSTGYENSFYGYGAGLSNTTGVGNTCIGSGADVNANNLTNATALGNGAISTASNRVWIGNTAVADVYCLPGVWNGSDGRFKFNIKEEVKGLDFIMKLRPVIYQMDVEKMDEHIIKFMPDSAKEIHRKRNDYHPARSKVRAGFIAQEVAQAAAETKFISSIVGVPGDSTRDIYGINYAEMVVPLVKAVQELSKAVDRLKAVQGQDTTKGGNGETRNVQDIKLLLPDVATLGEPQPNPNSGSTQIPYYLPQNTSVAKIIFTDMLGKVMIEKTLQPGYGLLNIDTQDLPAGVYSYRLMVDGHVIESKKMMRNK